MNSFFTFSKLLCLFLCMSGGASSQFKPENCTLPSTKWESLHYCAIESQPQKYQKLCMPKRLYPTLVSNNSKVKGVVTMYHGFTACPDAFNEIAKEMADLGYLVIVPLLPGMGLNLGYNCNTSPGTCISHGTNPSEIPISKQEYFSWSRTILDITLEEAALIDPEDRDEEFSVMALGLSVGGALAIYAAEQPDSPFGKVLVANPYLSTSTGQLDFFIYKCTLTQEPSKCISDQIFKQIDKQVPARARRFVIHDDVLPNAVVNSSVNSVSVPWQPLIKATSAVTQDLTVWSVKNGVGRIVTENYDGFLTSVWELFAAVGNDANLLANSLFDQEMGWGEKCSSNGQRGGICAFRIRHLVALQSFVEFVVANIDSIPTTIQYANIHSDMDGAARDSVSFAVYDSLKKRGVPASRCRFKYTCNIDQILNSQSRGDNRCGMILSGLRIAIINS